MKHNRFISNGIRFTVFAIVAITLTCSARTRETTVLPVRVYVMVGQSNMQGKGSIEGERPNALRNIVQNDPNKEFDHRQGGGVVTLRSEDLKEGVGLLANGREYQTAVVVDGKLKGVRITSIKPETPILVVGMIDSMRKGCPCITKWRER